MAVISSIVAPDLSMEPLPGAPEPRAPLPNDEGRNSLIVVKAVRGYLKQLPVPVICSGDALGAINVELQSLLAEAASRAHENGRKTLKPSDL